MKKATHVTIFWNLARNPEKNSSKIRRKNAKFELFAIVEHKFNADYGLSRGRTYSADEEDVEVILEDHTDEEKKTEGKTMLASCAV